MSLDFYLQYECDGNEIIVFDSNITHNLTEMADKAGIYYALWRPEEKGYKIAKDIISILEEGLKNLKEKPDMFKKYSSPNGWGIYEHFVPFVEDVYKNCLQYPNALIKVSR